MNYNLKDIELFLQQKQFIDTAIVPLLPVDFSTEGALRYSSDAEFLMSLVTYIEKQFRGRIFMAPPFPYFHKKGNIDIKEIEGNLKEEGFLHVLFITCDLNCKEKMEEVDMLILPAIPIQSMDQEVKNRILQDQLNYVLPKLTSFWTSK